MWLLRWILEPGWSSEICFLIFFWFSLFATRFRVGVLRLVGERDLCAVEKKKCGALFLSAVNWESYRVQEISSVAEIWGLRSEFAFPEAFSFS